MKKKKKNNVSKKALANGISEEGFTQLLGDIQSATKESIDLLNSNDEFINELRNNVPGENTEEWIEKFKTQVAESNNVINENLTNIEELFKRIFDDWKDYQKENVKEIDKGDTNE